MQFQVWWAQQRYWRQNSTFATRNAYIVHIYVYHTHAVRIARAIAFAINIQIKITHIDLFTAVAVGM